MEAALSRVHKYAHATDDSLESKLKLYDEWASDFEKDVSYLNYNAPKLCVDVLQDVMRSRNLSLLHSPTCKVIDYAAGTGLVGEMLRKVGFSGQMDAHDGSIKMLEMARSKSQYSHFYHCFIEEGKRMPIQTIDYDIAFLVGALSDSQVQPECLKVLLHHLKVSGLFVFSTRKNTSNLDYKSRLDGVISRLEGEGVWEKVVVKNYEEFERATSSDESLPSQTSNGLFPFIGGVVYCYKKLKDV